MTIENLQDQTLVRDTHARFAHEQGRLAGRVEALETNHDRLERNIIQLTRSLTDNNNELTAALTQHSQETSRNFLKFTVAWSVLAGGFAVAKFVGIKALIDAGL